MGIFNGDSIYKNSSDKFKFKTFRLKVKSNYLNKITHDEENYVYDTGLKYRCLKLLIDKSKRIVCINGWFQCVSSIYIDPNQGYTNIFETTLDEDLRNWSFRTLFFNKSDNKLYPAFIVVNGLNVEIGFANPIDVSYIDALDSLAAF